MSCWFVIYVYIKLSRICRKIDYFFRYDSDQSGYKVADHWDVMYDLGDPWYWTPTYLNEPQKEFKFGNIDLEYDDSGMTIGIPTDTIESYYTWGTHSIENVEQEFAANQLPIIGPRPKRGGDCEDFVLTKMQAIIEAGIIPKENLQIMLCWVVNAGSWADSWSIINTRDGLIKWEASKAKKSSYHAVLGIQTSNRGFLISDQRDYGQLWKIEQLKNTHIWDVMSVKSK